MSSPGGATREFFSPGGQRPATRVLPTPRPLSVGQAHQTGGSPWTGSRWCSTARGHVAQGLHRSPAAGSGHPIRASRCPVNDIVREFLLETHENLGQLDLDLVTLEKEP